MNNRSDQMSPQQALDRWCRELDMPEGARASLDRLSYTIVGKMMTLGKQEVLEYAGHNPMAREVLLCAITARLHEIMGNLTEDFTIAKWGAE